MWTVRTQDHFLENFCTSIGTECFVALLCKCWSKFSLNSLSNVKIII